MNKHLYALTATHRIRHQELKRRFSRLDTKQPGSTARLIKSVLADPKIALYVQHYTIDGCRTGWGWDSANMDGPEHVEYTAFDEMHLASSVRDSEYFSFDGVEEWITAMKRGEECVLIALALTLFPNLTSINYKTSINSLTSRILTLLIARTIRVIAKWNRPSGPLAKLISASFSASDYIFIDAIEVFTTLPSIKIINVENFGGNERRFEGLKDNPPILGSRVTDLNISCDHVPPRNIMPLVQSFEQLQSFTYGSESDSQQECLLDVSTIITGLLACARNSLRELEIRARSQSTVQDKCLRKFRVLESLNIDVSLLFGSSDTAQNLQSFLPASIREVKLHGWRPTLSGLRLHVINLTKSRNLLPFLSNIELFGTGFVENDAARFQNVCAKVNISLTFPSGGGYFSLATSARHMSHYAERQAKKSLTRSEVL